MSVESDPETPVSEKFDREEAEHYQSSAELNEAIDSLSEGDHLRLRVSWMDMQNDIQYETFDSDVVDTATEDGRRVDLDPADSRTKAPPVDGDWYIKRSSATAMREDSRIPYEIETLWVWKVTETDEYEFTLEGPAGLDHTVTVEGESREDALDTLSEWQWWGVSVDDLSGAFDEVVVAAPNRETAEERGVAKAEAKSSNKIDNGSVNEAWEDRGIAQLNHDWSDGREDWGENFIVRVEVDGSESVGSGVAPRAMDALVEYIGPEESAFDHADRPEGPSEISTHAARSAEWYSKGAKFTDAKTRLTVTLAGPEGLLDAEFDALEERVEDALPDLWMQEAVPSGPHENPYDEPYEWWASGGRAFFNGHEFTLTCGQCGEEMDFGALYGEGMQVNFVCESDACTTEQERVAGEGTFESKRSASVCPSNAPPSGWSAFVEGFEASIECDGDGWRLDATDEDETYTARLESETLVQAVVGDESPVEYRYEVYLGYEDHEYGTGPRDADEDAEYFEVTIDERDRSAAVMEAKEQAEFEVSHVEGVSYVGEVSE